MTSAHIFLPLEHVVWIVEEDQLELGMVFERSVSLNEHALRIGGSGNNKSTAERKEKVTF